MLKHLNKEFFRIEQSNDEIVGFSIHVSSVIPIVNFVMHSGIDCKGSHPVAAQKGKHWNVRLWSGHVQQVPVQRPPGVLPHELHPSNAESHWLARLVPWGRRRRWLESRSQTIFNDPTDSRVHSGDDLDRRRPSHSGILPPWTSLLHAPLLK